MNALHVLYDETCGFCCRCAEWISRQPSFVTLHCWPAGSDETKRRFPIEARGKQELVVIDEDGGVYRNTDAWLMTLWALREWREWSLRLSSGSLKPMARQMFQLASSWRHGLSRLLALKSDSDVKAQLEQMHGRSCEDGACEVERRCRSCGAATRSGHSFCSKCLADAMRAD
jgi:predicted DCC family thiol-disulfide oxidoreductase YuxK